MRSWYRVKQATPTTARMRSSMAPNHQARVLPMLMPCAPVRLESTSGRNIR
jgi:hypothetical protein